jgi:hypothetical protein
MFDSELKAYIFKKEIYLDRGSAINYRKIYNVLNLIGDVGGFLTIIFVIGRIFVYFYNSNQLIDYLFNSIFRPSTTVSLKNGINYWICKKYKKSKQRKKAL